MIKRKLFYAERLMSLNGEKSLEPISLSFTFSVEGNISYEIIRNALNKMQKKHPALRAHITKTHITYEDRPLHPIPIRIEERVSDDTWEEELEKNFSIPYNYEEGPLFRVVWIKSEKISDFILSGLHVVMDGKSILILAKEFFSLLNNPEKELKPYKPIVSLQELLPDIKITWKEKLFATLWTEIYRTQLFFKTVGRKKQPSTEKYSFTRLLDTETHEAFKEAAQRHGTGVGNLSCVLAMKIFKAHLHPQKSTCRIGFTLDIRRYISNIKKDMMFGFAPILLLNVDIPDDADLWEKACALDRLLVEKAITEQKKYKNKITVSFTKGLFFLEYYHRLINFVLKRSYTATNLQDFIFLNMGTAVMPSPDDKYKILRHYGSFRLPWRNPTTLIVLGDRDKLLGYVFSSAENFISKDEMLSIYTEFVAELKELIKK